MFIGLGVALLLMLAVGLLISETGQPSRKDTASKAGDQEKRPVAATPPIVPTLPPAAGGTTQPPSMPTVPDPISPTTQSPEEPGEPKPATPPTEEYNPRAAVAASLLAQAKAYYEANPDDPYEYKVKLEAVQKGYARTPSAEEAERLLGALKSLPPQPDALDQIPEAQAYRLVYDLNLSRLSTSISYDTDERANIQQPFDRIAYFLELNPKSGGKQWVFVSMDAFTDDLGKIGIPTVESGAFFQQNVTHMNVSSNVDGVVTGTELAGGNIEFWPNNYIVNNSANVPGAASNRYDFGDEPKGSGPSAGHGSMQVHNHDAKQTIFAINDWRSGPNASMGIGNRPKDHPDWTFSSSSPDYQSKRLRVFVRLK